MQFHYPNFHLHRGLHLFTGFFAKFSEPVIIRFFFYAIVRNPLFDRNTFRSFLTPDDDSQPVCTANIVSCLIHDSSTSKKLLVFSCSLEYLINRLTIQGVGFDAYTSSVLTAWESDISLMVFLSAFR